MVIDWDVRYEIGNELLDNQHKYLFELANNLFKAESLINIIEILDKLILYVNSHFVEEEGLMSEIEYPDIISHRTLHAGLSKKLKYFHKELNNNNLLVENIPKLVNEIYKFMSSWLLGHIMIEDIKFISFINT
jgi:hemerythrin